MNIESAINRGISKLKEKRIQTAQLDTEILMAKVLGKDRKYIILNNDQNLKKKNLEYLFLLELLTEYSFNLNYLNYLLVLVMLETQSFHQKLRPLKILPIYEVLN